jgi:hypothetical protein
VFGTPFTESGEIMGYFDGLVEANFKRDAEGRTLFYRWGVLGKGHVLPDQARAQQIRKFVRLYYMACLLAIIIVNVAFGLLGAFVLMAVLHLWYILATTRMLRGLETTTVRLTLAESYSTSARAHNVVILWVMLICSALFVVGGTLLVIDGRLFVGVLSIILFGACGVAIGYMIRSRHT